MAVSTGPTWFQEQFGTAVDDMTMYGVDLFEEDMDALVFSTNSFLTDGTMIGPQGPFWYILQVSMCLGALFAIIVGAGMAYKMMVKSEPFDVLKIMKVMGIGLVMCFWYPPSVSGIGAGLSSFSILNVLAYVPNAVGSWTHDLYALEALQVEGRLTDMKMKYNIIHEAVNKFAAEQEAAYHGVSNNSNAGEALNVSDSEGVQDVQQDSEEVHRDNLMTALIVGLDQLMIMIAICLYRIGWWGIIYCQQILLGMLTIFGPIQWAFSVLPKWEGAWAKWLIRYLTVHFYGAMLYFVGFYVLLLFDVVIALQDATLTDIVDNEEYLRGYMHTAFLTAGYMLIASAVALRCLDLIPDLAAWMIPEGETAFSTRSFGSGVAESAKRGASSAVSGLSRALH